LTNLRTIPLGDRWGGEISIEKNTITIVTTLKGLADESGVHVLASVCIDKFGERLGVAQIDNTFG
jgi:hypothetical protein